MSEKLEQAIEAGMVLFHDEAKQARIVIPTDVEFSDDEWLALIEVASEISRELRELGWEVFN